MASYKEKQMFKTEKDRKVIRYALKTLINNEKLSDIKFEVGIENKIYYGISGLFAMNSPKFNALLYDEKKTQNNSNDADVGLDDDGDDNTGLDDIFHLNHISCKSFEFIQSYFYQNPQKLTVDLLVDILFTCKEFELRNIESQCIKAIESIQATPKYKPYLIQIVNELYHKCEYEMVNNILLASEYIIVEFLFISLTKQYDSNIKPIYHGIAMKKNETINDLKRYASLCFVRDSIGKGSKDIIICTANNNSDIKVIENETVNIMHIINQCIVVYYCPTTITNINAFIDDNKSETKTETETQIVTIYNQSADIADNNNECISFPFVIKIQCDKSSDILMFKHKIGAIVGIILNDEGYITIKNGNTPFHVSVKQEQRNVLYCNWNTDIIKYIDNIWRGDICQCKLRDISNCKFKWRDYLFDEYLSDTDSPKWSIKDEVIYVRNNLKSNMDNPRFADVKFEIGKTDSSHSHKVFYAISALFAVQSTVFEAQFFGSMFESHGDIRLCCIDDISPDTFEFLREYFYNLDPCINTFNAVEIVYASTKYLLPSLQYPCSKFIHSLYDMPSFCDIYTCMPMMVQLYEIGFHDMSISLLNKSLHLQQNMYTNAYNVMRQKAFLSLPMHILKVLVCCDEFGADEYHIYEKVMEWAQFQIQKYGEDNIKNIIISHKDKSMQSMQSSAMRQLMNEFKYLIRWTLIPVSCYKQQKCGEFCLNKTEVEVINNLLTNPCKYLMQYNKFYNKFKCFYRDYNKYLDDKKCISYPYYQQYINSKNETILQFVYVDTDYNHADINRSLKNPTFYGCTMPNTATINHFRKYCALRFDVLNNDFENIFVCLILEGKIFHVFSVFDLISELKTDKYLICVYYSPLINIRNIKVKMDECDEYEYDDELKYDAYDYEDDMYPYCERIDGWNYRWNYVADIKRQQQKQTKIAKKRQHLLSIVHTNPKHEQHLKPLCGIPLLLNLFCEAKVNLFTLQKHFLSKIAEIIIDDQLHQSIINSNVHSIKFVDQCIKNYFNIVVRRNFIHYNALDQESLLKFSKSGKKIDTQNLLCLEFQSDQLHNFKKSFTYSIEYCRKHISVPPTSMQWKSTKDYTEKKMIRIFRTKDTMKLKAKINDQNV